MNRAPCLMVAAGGTGGHIFPAIAVAEVLREKGWKIIWLGSIGGLEERLVPMHNIELNLLPITGLRGKGLHTLIAAPWRLARSIWQAKKIIQMNNVNLVLGMGGFASGPGGIAAKLASIPLVLHEQNAIAGMTNRWLSKIASKTLAAFPAAFPAHKNVEVVGNPVRAAIRAAEKSTDSHLHVLVLGGSRGAKALNDAMPEVCKRLQLDSSTFIYVRHQTGKGHQASTRSGYEKATQGNLSQIEICEFIDNMDEAYRWADLVICRAGALTVSELAIAGLPAIFVPYPHAVDDHQYFNAKFFADAKAGWIVRQSDDMAEEIVDLLRPHLSDKKALNLAAHNSQKLAMPHAAKRVAEVCAAFVTGAAA